MLNIGLTGSIACGKSTVAQMFVSHGAYLIDFDKLAHEVQEPGKPAWQDVVDFFGPEVLQADQKIDRNKIAAVVFHQSDKLQKLGEIVHPRVYEAWRKRRAEIQLMDGHAIILADVPLLFEGHMQRLFDLTILVKIDQGEQIRRLMLRNAMSRKDADLRVSSQMSIYDKISLADIVIDNQGTIFETEKRVSEVWDELKSRERSQSERPNFASASAEG
ncbi:MAG TPA: dephospho-CoA kinase [Smithellaceae bacterium]|nr:dephospho-CoA kinase [Smithellaceae bacterium]HQM46586.1 dephospho-CoA kinase [Smithellaceae bacterium]